MKKSILPLFLTLCFCSNMLAQETAPATNKDIEDLQQQISNLRHTHDRLQKGIDDLLMYDRFGDVAYIDKVNLTGPPKPDRVEKNKDRQGYGNPFRFQSYIFIPKGIDANKKYPLIVLPHGGVHSNFNTYYTPKG